MRKLIDAQNGKCAICGELHRTLCVDHDHKTDVIRGGLCHACNLGLGYFKDDPARLHAAATYIETHLKTHHVSGID